MLAFDADKRLNTKQLLNNKYFDRVKDNTEAYNNDNNETKTDNLRILNDDQLDVKVDENTVDENLTFDYEGKQLSQDQVRKLICDQMAYYNPICKQKCCSNFDIK